MPDCSVQNIETDACNAADGKNTAFAAVWEKLTPNLKFITSLLMMLFLWFVTPCKLLSR
jgi:hypothetical protein